MGCCVWGALPQCVPRGKLLISVIPRNVCGLWKGRPAMTWSVITVFPPGFQCLDKTEGPGNDRVQGGLKGRARLTLVAAGRFCFLIHISQLVPPGGVYAASSC